MVETMNLISINDRYTLPVPDGFHVVEETDKQKLNVMGGGDWMGLSDPDRHLLMTLGWKKIGKLPSKLLNTQGLAKAMEKVIGEKGICARYGGDEFAFAFLDDTSMVPRLEDLRSRLETTAREICGTTEYLISASLGASSCPAENLGSLDQILAQADQALYADKSARKSKNPEAR